MAQGEHVERNTGPVPFERGECRIAHQVVADADGTDAEEFHFATQSLSPRRHRGHREENEN
jgi:hypothetical protein